jgi:hypothetical protein
LRDGERFADVCGAIDELKRSLHEEPDASATDPSILVDLVEGALRMQDRMRSRLAEYDRFREAVYAILDAIPADEASKSLDASAAARDLRGLLTLGRPLTEVELGRAVALAEQVRQEAAGLEGRLYRYKDAALAVARAYREVKGTRGWVLDAAEPDPLAVRADEEPLSRWLPASPHRERILRYLRVGRAHLISTPDHSSPPLVQFEDGGVMPLPDVRWSEDVRNFHHADAPPHPNGLRYRE